METKTALHKLGLSETEAKIYLALIKEEESTAVQIAKETEVHRRTIYDNLNLLLRKGIVSFKIKNGVKYFEATNPKNLKIFLEEKNKILEEILPTLTGIYSSNQVSPKVNVFIGIEGAKTVVEEALNSKDQCYWVGGGLFFLKSLKYSRKFVEKKLTKMKLKVIQPDIPESKELTNFVKKENSRLLPKSFVSRVGYLIYDNNLVIGIIQEEEITTIKITSEDAVQAFKNYFEVMWQLAK